MSRATLLSCFSLRLSHAAALLAALCLAPAELQAAPSRPAAAPGIVRVEPAGVALDSPEAGQQLLVTALRNGVPSLDLTHRATYRSLNPKVAAVSAEGVVTPVGEGTAQVEVRAGSNAPFRVPVTVTGLRHPAPISFENEVIPILTKAGCNAGGCHGKAEGQNGFKLSVFGFDPPADYQALAMEGRGRRISLANPDASLLLQKAASLLPHGGGKRMDPTDLRYRRLRRWIAEGARFGVEHSAPPAVAIEVEPKQQVLALKGAQQLRVTAMDAQGKRRCVTTEARYSSNAGYIADVDREGWVQAASVPGEAGILVSYMGKVAVCRITIPRPGAKFTRPAEANFIDRLAWDKLQRLGIPPSGPADDATFLRRVSLDTIGTLPTAAEARAFLADKSPQKRAKLIDALLERPEYADYWAMKWSDLLRVDKDQVQPQGAVAMTRWLRRQFAENRPYDQFARDVVTAQGPVTAEGPAAFYKVLDKPEVMSRSVSQLFLGVRIECAQCHHHPSERWGQDDYIGLAGFFTGVARKPLPNGDEATISRGGSDLPHPRTGQVIPARALGAKTADFTGVTDRRTVLADWMTAPDNPFFATAIANRLWAHYFGRGLVEPVDDLRATNPATNEPLLTALADHMRAVKYDLKVFTRTLLNSRLYALSSTPLPANARDEQSFSHATYKAMPAEVLLDAISLATGVAEKFDGWPEGYRAIQVWDNRLPSYFFQIFGRPVRASVCECERGNEPSVAQALHLMNSPEIGEKLHARSGVARELAASDRTPEQIIEELYLGSLSRYPTARERQVMLRVFAEAGADRRAAAEDVLWALLNSKEFVFNH